MLRDRHIHPLLLAVYPVLFLLAHNIAAVRPRAALVPLLLALVAGAVLWLVCGLVLRNGGKGALLASWGAVLFFGHGHLLKMLGGGATTAWILIGAGLAAFVAAGVWLARRRADLQPWNRTLDLIAIVLVVLALVPIVRTELRPPTFVDVDEPAAETAAPLGYLPDIYVIVLDAFGRADVLRDMYDTDMSGLVEHLGSRGFQVPARARANYNQTSLSLAALFNTEYAENLLAGFGPNYGDRGKLGAVVHENRVVRRLRGMGYQLVTLAGGSELAVQKDPDVHYRGGSLNEFQAGALALTPIPLVASLFAGDEGNRLDPYAQHREGVKYQLAKLPHVQAPAGPKLVFAHILTPHPPFVIGPEGEPRTPDYRFSLLERHAWKGYREGYAGQATWLAGALQKTVDGILDSSRRPPVILIMGDHGPARKWIESWRSTGSFATDDPEVLRERLAIFLALLLPPGEGGAVYPDLTPVNVFPLVFERCFGEPAKLKEDRSYFSSYERWADLIEVPVEILNPPADPER